ncbi:unnamed protein product [Closterium sp. NIES-53]
MLIRPPNPILLLTIFLSLSLPALQVPRSFHPQFSARWRRYLYVLPLLQWEGCALGTLSMKRNFTRDAGAAGRKIFFESTQKPLTSEYLQVGDAGVADRRISAFEGGSGCSPHALPLGSEVLQTEGLRAVDDTWVLPVASPNCMDQGREEKRWDDDEMIAEGRKENGETRRMERGGMIAGGVCGLCGHVKKACVTVQDLSGAFELTQSHVKKACVAVQDLSGAVADGGGAAGDSAAGGAAAGDGADGGGATGDSAAAVDGGNGAGAGAGAGAVYSIKEDANGKSANVPQMAYRVTSSNCLTSCISQNRIHSSKTSSSSSRSSSSSSSRTGSSNGAAPFKPACMHVARVHALLHALETHTRAHGPTCFRAFARDTAAGRGSGSATVCNLWRARAFEANLPVAAEKAGEPEGALAEGRAMCIPTGEAGAAGTAGVASAAGGAGMRVLCVELVGDRFLRRMVRVLVATAVREAAAGGGDTCLLRLAATGERRSTAPPAPAAGLCLVDVGYSDILPLPLGC